MATGRAMTAVVVGVRAHLVEVEAHLAQGLPHWAIVGLPDTAVSESRERVRAATASSGLPWPTGRITVGLSPASLPKRGSGLDLGIAVAVLASSAVLPDRDNVADWVFVGELGLDGSVRPVGTVLPAALAAARAGAPRLVVPAAHAPEAELVTGLQVMPVWTLRQLWGELTGDDSMAHQEIDVACAARRQVAPRSLRRHRWSLTWPTCGVNAGRAEGSRWPPPVATTSRSPDRRGWASRCWRHGWRPSFPISTTRMRSR